MRASQQAASPRDPDLPCFRLCISITTRGSRRQPLAEPRPGSRSRRRRTPAAHRLASRSLSLCSGAQEYERRFEAWLDNLKFVHDYNQRHASHWVRWGPVATEISTKQCQPASLPALACPRPQSAWWAHVSPSCWLNCLVLPPASSCVNAFSCLCHALCPARSWP